VSTQSHDWTHDHHLSERALSALADGEAGLVSPDAIAHSERCAECAQAISLLAEGTLELAHAYRSVAQSKASAWVWGVGGLATAAALAGGVSRLANVHLLQSARTLERALPHLARAWANVSSSTVLWTSASAILFTCIVLTIQKKVRI
jgi:hypothetical protein